MKSLQYLSFLLSGVAALPASNVARDDSPLAALEPLGEAISAIEPIVNLPHIPLGQRDDSPLAALEPLGETVSEIQPIVDLPHIPLGQRAESRASKRAATAAQVKEKAAELGAEIDLERVVPLDAYKKFARDAEDLENAAPHPLPKELVDLIVKKGYLGKRENAGVAKRGTFNAEAQLVNVTGDHKWIAPDYANGAKRGPCIGMNSLANHGFINRNGLATVAESIIAVNDVYGMGIDIATFLTTYSLVLAGNPLSLDPSYSIGDESDEVQNLLGNLGGLLGTPQGLDGTHNTFEVDGSGTRGDLYDPVGNNHDANISYFMDMYNLQKDAEEPNYDINVIIEHSLNRFKQAIAFNPYFYYGPFSGLVLRTGASFFAARLLVNCSEEHPEGVLGKENLKSFFGVTGPEDNMTYTRGHERIPENWYRRPDDYDVPGVGLDLVNAAIKNPTILGIGGNVNGVNTYVGVDIFNISGSVANAQGLLEGNNLLCFALQTLKLASPNSLSSLYTTLAKPLGMLVDVLDSSFASLACPTYGDLTVGGTDLFDYLGTFPGAKKSGTFF